MLVVLHCGSGCGTSLSLWFAVLKSVCVCDRAVVVHCTAK